MATQKFKAAINVAAFPFSYKSASQAVLIPQLDVVARAGRSLYGAEDTLDNNVITALLYENVMPTAKGITTVGYSAYINSALAVTDFDQLIVLRDAENNNVLFSPAGGKNYVLSAGAADWVSYSPFAFLYYTVTKAYVNGRTLVCYERTKLVEWDAVTTTLPTRTAVLPAGYAMSDIVGCAGASNYLLLFTETEILWSTTTDILDFATTSLGAGRQIPVELKGKITCILPIPGGCLIYTTENVVGASFTNDASRPFVFREVQNSLGLAGPEQATGDANIATHYAYGFAGIQAIGLQTATSIFAEATDFLAGPDYDVWDADAKQITSLPFGVSTPPKLSYIGSRYLIISYGPDANDEYQFCLVYDTVLQRWGKLRVLHKDVAELPVGSYASPYSYYELDGSYNAYSSTAYNALGSAAGTVIPRRNFGFLSRTGDIAVLEVGTGEYPGVAIYGHCQVLRNRTITIHEAELDGINSEQPISVSLLPSLDGAARTSTVPMSQVASSYKYAKFGSRITAKNIDVAIEAAMSLNSLVLGSTIHGSR